MCSLFGPGASQGEKSAQATSSDLSRSLYANYQTQFGEQQDVLKQLQTEIVKIETGQTGPGFSAAELAAKTGEIQNNAAAGERNARQAVENQFSGQRFGVAGGGSVSDESGLAQSSAVREQVAGEIGSAGENAKSAALSNLTTQNYEQGRRNAGATVSGLDALAGRYNPGQYAQEALGASNQSFGQAQTINKEDYAASGMNFLGGLIKSGIGFGESFLTGGLSNLGSGESFGEGAKDFFTGGWNQATGNRG